MSVLSNRLVSSRWDRAFTDATMVVSSDLTLRLRETFRPTRFEAVFVAWWMVKEVRRITSNTDLRLAWSVSELGLWFLARGSFLGVSGVFLEDRMTPGAIG